MLQFTINVQDSMAWINFRLLAVMDGGNEQRNEISLLDVYCWFR